MCKLEKVEKHPLVSIVTPVYNGEKYLEECICSLIEQSYRNIEIILINDGSKDNSLNICNQYKEKDQRITVVSQKNQGVSIARNKGIELSKGDYILFVDCDDVCDKSYVEKLVCETLTKEKETLVMCGIKTFDEGNRNSGSYIYGKGLMTTSMYVEDILSLHTIDRFCGGPYGKLYSKETIANKSIHFSENIHYAEDFCFNLEYLKSIGRIFVLDECLYFQREGNSDSLSARNFKKGNYDAFWEQRKHAYKEFKLLMIHYDKYHKVKQNVIKLLNIFTIDTEKYICRWGESREQCFQNLDIIRRDDIFEECLTDGLHGLQLTDRFRVQLFWYKKIKLLYIMEHSRYVVGKFLHKI